MSIRGEWPIPEGFSNSREAEQYANAAQQQQARGLGAAFAGAEIRTSDHLIKTLHETNAMTVMLIEKATTLHHRVIGTYAEKGEVGVSPPLPRDSAHETPVLEQMRTQLSVLRAGLQRLHNVVDSLGRI